jgi:glyoxylase-like metal-dependent hydrolase (beta-lactamase superfamily II)
VALYDGRGRNETPLWLPEQRALVFADGLTAPGGELRVWATPWHEERALPALRRLLELPFELVIVSHGEPVHDRAAFRTGARARPLVRLGARGGSWNDRPHSERRASLPGGVEEVAEGIHAEQREALGG